MRRRPRSGCPEGVSLDLGATAKALAADRAAAAAHAAPAAACSSALGGDIATAGPRAGRRLARPGDRRSPRGRRGPRSVDRPALRRPGHLEHGRAAVAGRRALSRTTCRSRHRCAPRRPCWRTVSVTAASVPGRQHREHGGDRPRRAGGRLARVAGAAEPARPAATARFATSPAGRPRAMTCAGGECQRGRVSRSLAAAGPSAYWYLARGTGAVALVLLTASVVLGILGSLRFTARRAGRGSRRHAAPRRLAAGDRAARASTSSPACSTASRRSR